MTIQKIATWVPVTDEMFIDGGFGTPEQRRVVAARIAQRQAESRARWLALPFYVRLYRRARWRWSEFRCRVNRTRAAWRGDDDD